MNIQSVTVDVGGRPLTIETGKYAKQAGGAVIVRQADSAVLVTCTSGTTPARFDFLPLSCEYMDRVGGYGRIPGGYLKREGRSNERETLASRLMDRPIRPLFPKTWRFETQIIATVLSFDTDCDTDVLSICGAAAAALLSDAPLKQPCAGVRVVRHGGQLIVNPTRVQIDEADLNIVVAGTADAVCMVEGGGKEVSEAVMMDAMDLAHGVIKTICAAIVQLREKHGGAAKREAPAPAALDEGTVTKAKAAATEGIRAALRTRGKHERREAIAAAKAAAVAAAGTGIDDAAQKTLAEAQAAEVCEKILKVEMRGMVISEGVRIDGRATDEIRPIWTEVGISPRAHGSAVFTRGETQVFATVALGVEDDGQRLDYAGVTTPLRRWMLQYNFPPFCTGESYPMRGPKRREIGHGALAHRAIQNTLPAADGFPYVIRCSADVLESNGSSSMGTVCAGTLALLDAGVPVKAPVAGIAMGLIKEGEEFAVLSDILGDEDHLGDMDFKVTGTTAGITAFQMDTKISGVSRDIMTRALAQAREGRLHILAEMAKTISAPRPEMSPYAPRITTIQIKTEKIKDIIGPGGKVIRGLQDKTGCKLTVHDDGRIDVASTDQDKAAKCIAMIREITAEAEIGKLYVGVVKRITDFGAFVEIFPGTDGLVHISHLAKERVNKVTDIVNEGDEVLVRVIDIDKAGKIRLSRKEALED
ncbi:MAG: polyribonucleotide nucleotidyltransferase [Deltaproteobacteria bacterium]|nr:polyribonucleotide nucleotidyltransferase [Deltaproteobacteria bacterium]